MIDWKEVIKINNPQVVISKEGKFIYFRPGKTAGNSIDNLTIRKYYPDSIRSNYTETNRFENYSGDLFKDTIESISNEELESYYKFVSVRNPWERLVSLAAYMKCSVQHIINLADKELEERRFGSLRAHYLPYNTMIEYKRKKVVDKVLRLESLDDDWIEVREKLKLPKLQISNKSEHKHYRDVLTEDQVKWVKKYYKKDIKLTGYKY